MKKCAFFWCLTAFFCLFFCCTMPRGGARLATGVSGARYSLYLGEGRFYDLPPCKFSYFGFAALFFQGEILAEEVRFSAQDYSVEQVLSLFGANVIRQERIEQTTVWYCRAAGLICAKTLPFGKVNMQIACTGQGITVGFPVIYGGF